MALTLRSAITANQTTVDVNGLDPLTEGDLLTVGDETIEVRTASPNTAPAPSWQRLSVYRERAGTSKGAHAANAALTLVTLGAGGGAAEAGTVVQYETGTGTATGRIFIGDVDPATDPAHPEYAPILEGEPWVDTTGGWPWQNKVRTNVDEWEIAPIVLKDANEYVVSRIWINSATGGLVMERASFDDGPLGSVLIEPDGTVHMTFPAGVGAGGDISLNSAGAIALSGASVFLPDVVKAILPTADPVVADQLWNNAGVVQVSAG